LFQTHPDLDLDKWYRTPLDFVSPFRRFRGDVHWRHFSLYAEKVRLPVFSRRMPADGLWDRIPYRWHVIEHAWMYAVWPVVMAFAVSPFIAWNFHFPTPGERLAWRVCVTYLLVASVAADFYFYISTVLLLRKSRREEEEREGKLAAAAAAAAAVAAAPRETAPPLPLLLLSSSSSPSSADPSLAPSSSSSSPSTDTNTTDRHRHGISSQDVEKAEAETSTDEKKRRSLADRWIGRCRNISPDGDPEMRIGLRATFIPMFLVALGIGCRLFVVVEDLAAFRAQPAGIYRTITLEGLVPFL